MLLREATFGSAVYSLKRKLSMLMKDKQGRYLQL